ncbi:MAG TPA: PHP domain-containing protein [Patescibacteria group bacterium]|nr:PHP domain-containing protein [Patescibacteria group bacterium]
MYKADFHTHSIASPDGSLTLGHYRRILDSGTLDYAAVTDHNTISFAQKAQAVLGDKIIVGEEITTTDGEIIGLFLHKVVPAGLSLGEAIDRIKQQGGLVYVPHPFETVRSGLAEDALEPLSSQLDIVEVNNGRAVFQNRSAQAKAWAGKHSLPGASSSDSHGWHGWGKTYTEIAQAPDVKTLAKTLKTAKYVVQSPGLRGILYPKYNRLRKALS